MKDFFKKYNIKRIPYDFSRLVSSVFIPWFRIKKRAVSGSVKDKKRIRGAAILVANHPSKYDPLVVSTCFLSRRTHYLVAEVVMSKPFRAMMLRGLGAIKIDRTIFDLEAIKKAVEVLKMGELLAVFPQGQIVKDSHIDHVKGGAVLIALQSGAPIIPLYIKPRKDFWHRTEVVIGDSFSPKEMCGGTVPSLQRINELTDILHQRLEQCREAAEKEQ